VTVDSSMTAPAAIARLEAGRVSPAALAALRAGVLLARADTGVVALTGPGAVTCFQGLLTNDIEKPGDGAFVYGALLTPKGMIVVDGWATRLGTTVSYTVPALGCERALGILTRSVPPRLARFADRTTELAVFRLAGPRTQALAAAVGLPVPPTAGRAVQAVTGDGGVEVARPGEAAPFALQISVPVDHADALRARLVAAGALWTDADALEFARILAGWPGLGTEVDDKTIPQEVRYDELGGVSYTKGCYTGQETVSRLHFRGHTNRYLRGLMFDAEPAAAPAPGWIVVTHLDRDVGRVTSLAWVPEAGVAGGGLWIGLALLRREVIPGTVVRAAGRDARVVELPFALPVNEPA
jgi:tRNA-modifying protein YgfZ